MLKNITASVQRHKQPFGPKVYVLIPRLMAPTPRFFVSLAHESWEAQWAEIEGDFDWNRLKEKVLAQVNQEL